MYKGKKIVAIIPARGGSKGIPNKNTQLVNNKPLIAYTIETALNSDLVDEVIVSTDSVLIKKEAEKYGALVPFIRPSSLASDTSKTIDAIIYTLQQLKGNGNRYDYVITLQPTQPLRTKEHIDQAIKETINNDWPSLVSVSKVHDNPILIRELKNRQKLIKIVESRSDIRRQDFKDYYKVNGVIYLNKINDNLSINTSLNDNEFAYVMEQEFDLDIDTVDDLEKFRLIVSKKDHID